MWVLRDLNWALKAHGAAVGVGVGWHSHQVRTTGTERPLSRRKQAVLSGAESERRISRGEDAKADRGP